MNDIAGGTIDIRDALDLDRMLDTEPEQLAAVVARLRRFVSAPLADLIVHGGADSLRPRRCEVSVVFLDLRGFTSFAEAVEPEDVMYVLHGYHQAVGQLVSSHRAMLERFTGDGIMVYFNAPIPVHEPQRRAVEFALSAHERVASLAREWRLRGADLSLGAGISHGFATVGPIGFEERYDYAAIGSVTNLASRLCARARAEETLVCERVMRAVEPYVEAQPLGPVHLRGFHRPRLAYRLTGLKPRL